MKTFRPLLLAVPAFFLACGSGDAVRSGETAALSSDSKKSSPLCVTPWGTDFCALAGTNTAFVVSDALGGPPVPVGSWWTPLLCWATNARGGLPGFPLTYPPGYVTAHPDDPMQDFLSKIVSFTVVVDPGTRQERSYVYTDPAEYEAFMTFGEFWGAAGFPPFAAAPAMCFIPSLHPLSVGAHEIHSVWTLSALHCDGFPTGGEPPSVETGSCFPAGDFAVYPSLFSFTFSFAPPSSP